MCGSRFIGLVWKRFFFLAKEGSYRLLSDGILLFLGLFVEGGSQLCGDIDGRNNK